MKHIILTLISLAVIFISCSDNNDDPQTITISKDQLNQTVYADNTEKGITFTATEAWRTEVDYTGTKATEAAEQWVTLDPSSGGAGEVTIKVTLSVNRTGADRIAKVRIVCGGTTITIVIEQKGETEEGKIPDAGTYDKLVSKIDVTNTNIWQTGSVTSNTEWSFAYDNQNRITFYKEYSTVDGGLSSEFAYSGNTITSVETIYDNNAIEEIRSTYILNAEGNIVEWSDNYTEMGKPFNNKGKITYKDGYFASSETTYSGGSDYSDYSDYAIWENGNLVKAADSDNRYYTLIEYGNIRNDYNIDFNYLLAESEWLDCLAFEGRGMKPFGYFGKRSAYLISKETDSYDNNTYTHEYKTDSKGYINEIILTRYDSKGEKTSEKVLKISYIDAK